MFRKRILSLLILSSVLFSVAFADCPSHWAKESYDLGLSKGILHHDINANYSEFITREDFAKLVVHYYIRQKGYNNLEELLAVDLSSEFDAYEYPFKDLDYSLDSYKYIVAANILGFVNGVSSSEFAPTAKISREQAAKMLFTVYEKVLKDNSLDVEKHDEVAEFIDHSSISQWANKYVYPIRALGIMNGEGDNLFNPKGKYTREQAAVTVVRLSQMASDVIEDVEEHSPSDYERDRSSDDYDHETSHHQDEPHHTLPPAESQVGKEHESFGVAPPPNLGAGSVAGSDHLVTMTPPVFEEAEEPEIEKPSLFIALPNAYELKCYENKVVELVNKERADAGLQPLQQNPNYYSHAMTRAEEIVETFSHTRPDGSDFNSGIDGYSYAGENLAKGQDTPQKVVSEWMESPDHRENILRPEFTHITVAVYYKHNSEYKWHWVQIFSTP